MDRPLERANYVPRKNPFIMLDYAHTSRVNGVNLKVNFMPPSLWEYTRAAVLGRDLNKYTSMK